jgi:hypothetical protein
MTTAFGNGRKASASAGALGANAARVVGTAIPVVGQFEFRRA